MILTALIILSIGVADLIRSRASLRTWRSMIALVVSSSAVWLSVWGTGQNAWWAVATTAVAVGWVVITAESSWAQRLYPWPIVALAAAVILALARDPIASPPSGWLVSWYEALDFEVLQTVTFERFFLGLASVLFLTETANVIVRMVLGAAGTQILETEKSLQGGRMLGPIERLFIFFMALAGQFLAIGAVVAAKGILRYPEISGNDKTATKAEYVLVGSFVSWGIAFLTLPLLL